MRELWYAFVRWLAKPSRKERLVVALEEIAENTFEMRLSLASINGYEGRRNTREQTMYQAWQDMQEPEMMPAAVPTPMTYTEAGWQGIDQAIDDHYAGTVSVGIAGGGSANF